MSISKFWMFTINNYTDDDKPLEWPCSYVIYQKEKGASGTPHLQGYVEFLTNKRLSAVRKICSTAHWETRKGTQQQAIDYCTKKDDTYVDGPWDEGDRKENKQGQRTDLELACAAAAQGGVQAVMNQHPTAYVKYHAGLEKVASAAHLERVKQARKEQFTGMELRPWQASLNQKLLGPPDDRTVHWYWEDTGNVGKTWMAKYLKATQGATVLDCSKKADLAYLLRGHQGKIVVFNIVRSMDEQYMGHVYGTIESIKDDMVVSTKYEPVEVPLGPQHVVVFANVEPDYTKWSEDRYSVKKIPGEHKGIGGVSFKGGKMGVSNPFAIRNADEGGLSPKSKIRRVECNGHTDGMFW